MKIIETPIYQADAFTSVPFKGNPAAVCFLESPLSDSMLQAIAAENFLPETAFVLPAENGYSLRWFSPTVEIPLCGHATLATAHVMWEQGIAPENEPLIFHTLSGDLIVTKEGDWIHLNFPGFKEQPIAIDPILEKAIGAKIIAATQMQNFIVLEIEQVEAIPTLKPDLNALLNFDAVIVTAKGSQASGYDFVSRVFGPSIGIPEDPVTGSAHCCLAPYWGARLNKTEMLAYQASARGGEVKVRIEGERVRLSGKGVTVIKGNMKIPVEG